MPHFSVDQAVVKALLEDDAESKEAKSCLDNKHISSVWASSNNEAPLLHHTIDLAV
jgi:hypothetical protein